MAGFLRPLTAILLAALVSGCATYHQPRYGHDGVYYEQAPSRHSTTVVRADPLLYPYWSLDYFYFSRYYHPYSVWVGAADPWFYPYPGWYYGYRPGPRARVSLAFGSGFYYPWYSFGYHWHHPWGWSHIHYPRYVSPPPNRVRHVDERLRMLENRQRAAVATHSPPLPAATRSPEQARITERRTPEEQQLQRAALRERHRSSNVPRHTRPLSAGHPGTVRQPATGTFHRRDASGTSATGERRSDTRTQPAERQPDTSRSREVLRDPGQRQPAPVDRQRAPARAQPTAPPRTQPSSPPQRQPAPPPPPPAAPARSRPAERSTPTRERGRARERER